MERPPRRVDAPIFSRRMVTIGLVQGGIVLLAVLAVYGWGVLDGLPDTDVRAMSFTTLVVANLGLIFVNRSWTHTVLGGIRYRNPALWIVAGGTLATLALLLWLPSAQRLFDFSALQAAHVAIGACVGAASVLWFDGYKLILGRRRASVA